MYLAESMLLSSYQCFDIVGWGVESKLAYKNRSTYS